MKEGLDDSEQKSVILFFFTLFWEEGGGEEGWLVGWLVGVVIEVYTWCRNRLMERSFRPWALGELVRAA